MLRHVAAVIERWFFLIAEPRVQRILHFVVYSFLTVAGTWVLTTAPAKFEDILGITLVYVFGGFVTFGALVAAVAVLPGVWWLERVGILSLSTGLGLYLIFILTQGVSVPGFLFFACFVLMFSIRWMDIRLYQLAPKRG